MFLMLPRAHAQVLVFILLLSVGGHTFMPTDTYDVLSLEVNKTLKYNALMNSFATVAAVDSVFWQLGMTLEPMINYCQKSREGCEGLGKMAYEAFKIKTSGTIKWWYDDFGWWGFAFFKLHEATLNPQYLEASVTCFENMLPAKRVWSSSKNIQKLKETPRFDHGCFNSDAVGGDSKFEGIQNTVTNAQFLRLTLALFDNAHNAYRKNPTEENENRAKIYWHEAMEQYQWFLNWFKQGLLNNSFAGANHLLVEERIGTYHNDTAAREYKTNRFWIGDQGLLLASLAHINAIKTALAQHNPLNLDRSKLSDDTSKTALGIAQGVKKQLMDAQNILRSFNVSPNDQFPFGDISDYLTGPGAYLSSMVTAQKYSEALHKKFRGDAYQIMIKANALRALAQPNQIGDINSFIAVANDLAALHAAVDIR